MNWPSEIPHSEDKLIKVLLKNNKISLKRYYMIPYIGGKSFLSSWIISNFPEDYKTKTYIEVFGGAGWVLLKKEPSYLEVYNDLNKDLVNLFKVVRDNYDAFKHRTDWCLHSREMYAEAKERLKDDTFLDEIERAMYFAIDKGQSFSGRGGWGYQVTAKKMISGKWLPFVKRLEFVNSRLEKVEIECLDFEKLIKKYDHDNALFYVDPPYYEAEHYYDSKDVHFRKDDHIRLAETLKNIKGKFVLSYYDCDFVNELYKGYRMLHKDVPKHSAGCKTGESVTKPRGKELLIMNY